MSDLFENIIEVIFTFIIYVLVYYTGWMVLKAFTLGKYPSRVVPYEDRHFDASIGTGMGVYLLIFTGFILINNNIVTI